MSGKKNVFDRFLPFRFCESGLEWCEYYLHKHADDRCGSQIGWRSFRWYSLTFGNKPNSQLQRGKYVAGFCALLMLPSSPLPKPIMVVQIRSKHSPFEEYGVMTGSLILTGIKERDGQFLGDPAFE